MSSHFQSFWFLTLMVRSSNITDPHPTTFIIWFALAITIKASSIIIILLVLLDGHKELKIHYNRQLFALFARLYYLKNVTVHVMLELFSTNNNNKKNLHLRS